MSQVSTSTNDPSSGDNDVGPMRHDRRTPRRLAYQQAVFGISATTQFIKGFPRKKRTPIRKGGKVSNSMDNSNSNANNMNTEKVNKSNEIRELQELMNELLVDNGGPGFAETLFNCDESGNNIEEIVNQIMAERSDESSGENSVDDQDNANINNAVANDNKDAWSAATNNPQNEISVSSPIVKPIEDDEETLQELESIQCARVAITQNLLKVRKMQIISDEELDEFDMNVDNWNVFGVPGENFHGEVREINDIPEAAAAVLAVYDEGVRQMTNNPPNSAQRPSVVRLSEIAKSNILPEVYIGALLKISSNINRKKKNSPSISNHDTDTKASANREAPLDVPKNDVSIPSDGNNNPNKKNENNVDVNTQAPSGSSSGSIEIDHHIVRPYLARFNQPFPPANLSRKQILRRLRSLGLKSSSSRWPAMNVNDSSMSTCSICFVELAEGDIARRLPCMHVFHSACLIGWFVHPDRIDVDLHCVYCQFNLNTEKRNGAKRIFEFDDQNKINENTDESKEEDESANQDQIEDQIWTDKNQNSHN